MMTYNPNVQPQGKKIECIRESTVINLLLTKTNQGPIQYFSGLKSLVPKLYHPSLFAVAQMVEAEDVWLQKQFANISQHRHGEQLMSPVHKEGNLGQNMIPYGGGATLQSYQWQDP